MFDKKEETLGHCGRWRRNYRSNTALLELRMKQLQVAQRRARHKEVKYRLKQRIGCLRVLINEEPQNGVHTRALL